MASASDRFVHLRNGWLCPVAALRLLWDLETRGLQVERDGEGIVVFPPGRLTEDDRAGLRRWRTHVLLLLDHVADDAHLRTSPRPLPAPVAPDDPAVRWRLAGMWRHPHPIPTAKPAHEAPGGPSRCYSCGDPLHAPDSYARCALCWRALELFYAAPPFEVA